MPNYDNESCAECRYFVDIDFCGIKRPDIDPKLWRDDWPDINDRCDYFTPSVECRKVLALETIASCVDKEEHGVAFAIRDYGPIWCRLTNTSELAFITRSMPYCTLPSASEPTAAPPAPSGRASAFGQNRRLHPAPGSF